jgi:hypothetical protein
MSDGGSVTAEVNGFTVTSNSAKSESELRANLKGRTEESVSNAGRELGKLGAKAAAEKRAEAKETKPEAEPDEPKAAVGADKLAPEPAEAKGKAEEPGEGEKEAKAAPEKVEAAPDEDKDKVEEQKPEDKKPNPRHDPRARMLEATRQAAEAKRQLAEEQRVRASLEQRLAALEQRIQPPADGKPARDASKRPTLEDFLEGAPSYEAAVNAFQDARDQYNFTQFLQFLDARAQHATHLQQFEQRKAKFAEVAGGDRIQRYSPDVLLMKTSFQLDHEAGETPSGENWIADTIFERPEIAPALLLHFSEHEDERQRIAALRTREDVTFALASLVTRLEAAPTGVSSKPEEDVSRAAPPVKPVTGKPYAISDEYKPGMSLDEYAKVWNKAHRLR